MGPNNSTHAQVLDVVLYRIIPDRNELRQAGHDKRTRREKSHTKTHTMLTMSGDFHLSDSVLTNRIPSSDSHNNKNKHVKQNQTTGTTVLTIACSILLSMATVLPPLWTEKERIS